MIALLVFLLNLAGYTLFWYSLSGDVFGGDIVNLACGKPYSYFLGEDMIQNRPAFFREILAERELDPNLSPGAFVYSRLSEPGRAALQRLAAGSGRERDWEFFLLEFNRSLVDPEVHWPPAFLNRLDPKTQAQAKMAPPQGNLLLLSQLFPRYIRHDDFTYAVPGLLKTLPAMARMYFTLQTPLRYTPLTSIYATYMGCFLANNPRRIPAAVIQMAFLYACLATSVFLLAGKIIGSTAWALVATFLFQAAGATIVSVYTLFSLPYLLVTIVMAAALYAYLQYQDSGALPWLAAYILLVILGSWVREFPAATPFIVAVSEALTYKGKRSLMILAASVALMGLCLYPTFLPWLLGWNQGQVFSLLSMSKTQSHATLRPNWDLDGFVYVQFPPVLWLLAVISILLALRRWREGGDWGPGSYLHSGTGLLARIASASARDRRRLGIWAEGLVVALAALFVLTFYVFNANLQWHPSIRLGWVLFLFLAMVAAASLRFHVLPPIYFLAMLVGMMIVRVAEVHLTFLLPPLAIMLTLEIRELFSILRKSAAGRGRRTLMAGVVLLCGLGMLDQALNLPASILVQRELVKKNQELGVWIKDNVPRHSIVIANFYYYADLFYYSGRHFDPYESVENNPFPKKVIHTETQMQNLLKRNQGLRNIYLLEAEHPYMSPQKNYHTHKWVKNPPGELEKLATFSLKQSYYYADPAKYFTPRYWLSFPGYMDWFIDYWWENSRSPFRRVVYSDYVIYRLKEVNQEVIPKPPSAATSRTTR
ncbi:MAG: hypothetical protein AB1491_00765 [Thermodesulfobacteriota bacterium]